MFFILLIIETFNLIMFLTGVIVTQKFQNKETIEIPNPIETVKKCTEEYKEKSEEKKRQKEIDIMLENINNYDGTDAGQKDIP